MIYESSTINIWSGYLSPVLIRLIRKPINKQKIKDKFKLDFVFVKDIFLMTPVSSFWNLF